MSRGPTSSGAATSGKCPTGGGLSKTLMVAEGTLSRIRGTTWDPLGRRGPDESLWTRIAFYGVRPPGSILAAFSHVAEQRGSSHPCSPRPAQIDPHLADPVI